MQTLSEPSIKLIQNPVSSHILLSGYTGPVSITDALGRTLLKTNFTEGGLPVDFLTRGYYYLQLNSRGITFKFLKL
jgi:hypothetical protein